MIKSEKIMAVMGALKKAQDAISPVKKDAINPFFESKYATLESILDAIKGPLDNNSLVITQIGDRDVLETILYHVDSGEYIGSKMSLMLEKQSPQGYGSSLTYVKRYSICALLQISTTDDDGNSADLPSIYASYTTKCKTADDWTRLGGWLKSKKADAELMKRYTQEFKLWSETK